MDEKKVIVADPCYATTLGVANFLGSRGYNVLQAQNEKEIMALLDRNKKQDLILEFDFHGNNGATIFEHVNNVCPNTNAVIYTGNNGRATLSRVLNAGIRGYVLKTAPIQDLHRALEAITKGDMYICGEMAKEVVGLDKSKNGNIGLTDRQIDILRMIAQGMATKTIADKLNISCKTTEKHRQRLMKNLGIHEIATLTRYAIRAGLVD